MVARRPRRSVYRAAARLVLFIALGGTAWAAAGAMGWVVRPTPDIAGARDSYLSSVSCKGPKVCTAVGDFVRSHQAVTLAEHWNGTSWKVQPTPKPDGALNRHLAGVSCPAANACTAVGYRDENIAGNNQTETLVERWNGATWKVQLTPNPDGASNSYLVGVSCPAVNACLAVGNYESASSPNYPFYERWNGTSWTESLAFNPPGARGSFLIGISCTAANACTAVGHYLHSNGNPAMLVERWNGSSWTMQSTPTPAGAHRSDLLGVSCSAANACTAVGYYRNAKGKDLPLALRWNGASWTVQAARRRAGAKHSFLEGVSCSAAKSCTAVGQSPRSRLLAEHWNGASWAIQSAPIPSGASSSALYGVACRRSSACVAVGGYYNSKGKHFTLAERHPLTFGR